MSNKLQYVISLLINITEESQNVCLIYEYFVVINYAIFISKDV